MAIAACHLEETVGPLVPSEFSKAYISIVGNLWITMFRHIVIKPTSNIVLYILQKKKKKLVAII